ncbi:MAG TPA: prephenate dehydrogenase/arogenate dehydrogenase family protein, partial [Candidatus Babeliales bacterium]|nr:prephenate dehydrogenase/arogenate dehydrogenase family protein [Candidatus Babeliales bacterium]
MTGATLGVIGVGAIGGSIGLRARRDGTYVVGADCDAAALAAALELGAIDASATERDLPRVGDTLVIAAPLEATLREIARLARAHDSKSALILDVASVKL